jgi:hypothetical protein
MISIHSSCQSTYCSGPKHCLECSVDAEWIFLTVLWRIIYSMPHFITFEITRRKHPECVNYLSKTSILSSPARNAICCSLLLEEIGKICEGEWKIVRWDETKIFFWTTPVCKAMKYNFKLKRWLTVTKWGSDEIAS